MDGNTERKRVTVAEWAIANGVPVAKAYQDAEEGKFGDDMLTMGVTSNGGHVLRDGDGNPLRRMAEFCVYEDTKAGA